MCTWSRWSWPLVVVTTLVATTGCTRRTAQAQGRDDPPKAVAAVTVEQESVRRAVEVVGTLAAADEVTISSEAEGKVSRILADLGDRVKAGDALVELDREKSQDNLDLQRAALARALAQYGAADPEHLPPIEQTPDVQRANADRVQAQQAFDRADELAKRNLLPKQALDDAEAAMHSKQASYESALQGAKNLQANIQASEASMRLADRQLRDTSIRSPFDGYVEKRMVNLGELVKLQMPVMSVVRMDPLKVTAEIPEKMAPWIRAGQPVELRVDAFPTKAIAGKISRISPAVNTATRAFPFEAVVQNGDALLKPGTFARVHIESGQVDQVTTVPYAALQYRYGVNRVYVVDGDRLAMRELQVGERIGDRIEVVSGVKAGERVVVTDVDKLVDGTKITASRLTE